MKDLILVALLVVLGALALGLFGFFGLESVLWDNAYDQALGKYKEAYAHRDDAGPNGAAAFIAQYELTERQLEGTHTEDPEKLQKAKDLHACGLSLQGYLNLKAHGFRTDSFEKAAAACAP